MKLIPFSERKLKKWIAKDVSFYCFGAGTKLRSLCNTIEGFEKQIAHIADNNDKIQGSFFSTGKRVVFLMASHSKDFQLKPHVFPLKLPLYSWMGLYR